MAWKNIHFIFCLFFFCSNIDNLPKDESCAKTIADYRYKAENMAVRRRKKKQRKLYSVSFIETHFQERKNKKQPLPTRHFPPSLSPIPLWRPHSFVSLSIFWLNPLTIPLLQLLCFLLLFCHPFPPHHFYSHFYSQFPPASPYPHFPSFVNISY